jgi:phospholipase D1/2
MNRINVDRALERARAAVFPIGLVGLILLILLAMPAEATVEAFGNWFAPHRRAWYALPGVVLMFVALGLLMVPVLLLIAATGVAFGPWLGPAYAMAGCLASASAGFAIGRWVGLDRAERLGGKRLARAARAMARHGILAVFLLRKIPIPFLLANVFAGATPVRYRDFVIGTTLGMVAVVIALAGFGYHVTKVLDDPSPRAFLLAAIALAGPLTLAWLLNRSLRPREDAA